VSAKKRRSRAEQFNQLRAVRSTIVQLGEQPRSALMRLVDERHAPPWVRPERWRFVPSRHSIAARDDVIEVFFGMRRGWTFAAASIGAALALAPFERGLAAGGPFDGLWDVQIDCQSVGDVEGYSWRFPAEVSSGFLSGLYRSATSSAIGHITGHIGPDGGALLTMDGRTGPEQRSFGHQRPGVPFRYTVDAHFDASGGTGKRNEQRPCALTFNRS
jgi:hypothetical protein